MFRKPPFLFKELLLKLRLLPRESWISTSSENITAHNLFESLPDWQAIAVLEKSMTRTPVFAHTRRVYDFLLIRKVGKREWKYYLRPLERLYTSGQQEPRKAKVAIPTLSCKTVTKPSSEPSSHLRMEKGEKQYGKEEGKRRKEDEGEAQITCSRCGIRDT